MKGGVSESAQQTCVERERERDTSKIIFIGINIQIQKYLTVRCHIYSKSIKTDKKEKKPITKDFKSHDTNPSSSVISVGSYLQDTSVRAAVHDEQKSLCLFKH